MASQPESIRKAVWLMLVEPSFRDAIGAGEVKQAASRHGIDLTDEEAQQLEQLDPQDLDELLSRIDRDMSVLMGGSRPRPLVALSEETISELRKALGDYG